MESFRPIYIFGKENIFGLRHKYQSSFVELLPQVATDTGVVQMFDARNDDKAVWTLKAHSEGVNGLVMSTQCPGCLITGSSDKTIKVWDIADGKPTCVHEQNMKLGMIHCMSGCPDAPFVTVMGGDKSSDNIKVFSALSDATRRYHT